MCQSRTPGPRSVIRIFLPAAKDDLGNKLLARPGREGHPAAAQPPCVALRINPQSGMTPSDNRPELGGIARKPPQAVRAFLRVKRHWVASARTRSSGRLSPHIVRPGLPCACPGRKEMRRRESWHRAWPGAPGEKAKSARKSSLVARPVGVFARHPQATLA